MFHAFYLCDKKKGLFLPTSTISICLFGDSAPHCYLPGTLSTGTVRVQDFFLMKVCILQKLISIPEKTGMV